LVAVVGKERGEGHDNKECQDVATGKMLILIICTKPWNFAGFCAEI